MRHLNVNGFPPKYPGAGERDNLYESEKGRIPTPMMIINEISKLMGDKIRLEGDDAVMQKSSRLLMMALAHKDGRTQLDLVKETHLKAPTVSVTLQKMEKDGIVIRRPDEYDLRAMRVYLTEKGREIDRSVISRIHEEEKIIMQGITEKETETLMEILLKMRNNISDRKDMFKFEEE